MAEAAGRERSWAPDAAERLLLVRWHWRGVRAGQRSLHGGVDGDGGAPRQRRQSGLSGRLGGSDLQNLIDEAGHGRARFDVAFCKENVLGRNDHLSLCDPPQPVQGVSSSQLLSGAALRFQPAQGREQPASQFKLLPFALASVCWQKKLHLGREGQALLDIEFIEAEVLGRQRVVDRFEMGHVERQHGS